MHTKKSKVTGFQIECLKKIRLSIRTSVLTQMILKEIKKEESSLINDIIFNDKAHIVALFKDYLIIDDSSEFLKRIYKMHECLSRLPKFCEFYDSYSKIFPSYINLPEAKYMYKNIKRKQKVIDNNQLINEDEEKFSTGHKVFDTIAVNSIMNQTNQLEKMNESQSSFQGVIESITKAENLANHLSGQIKTVIFPGKIEVVTKGTVNANYSKIAANKAKAQNQKNKGNSKDTYNFQLNLNKLDSCSGGTDQKSTHKMIINQIDDLQKLKLKVNAGLINSARVTQERNNFDEKNKLISKFAIQDIENNRNNTIQRDLNTIDSTGTVEKLSLTSAKSKVNKPSSNNVIIEESLKGLTRKQNTKISHKATTSMPKLNTNNLYSNYNISNIIPKIINNNIQEEAKINPTLLKSINNSNSKIVSNYTSLQGNYKIKINSKKSVPEFESNRPDSKLTSHDPNKENNSARNNKEKKTNILDNITRTIDAERIYHRRILSSILGTEQKPVNSSRNTIETKAKPVKKTGRTASTVNLNHKELTSYNCSLLQNKKKSSNLNTINPQNNSNLSPNVSDLKKAKMKKPDTMSNREKGISKISVANFLSNNNETNKKVEKKNIYQNKLTPAEPTKSMQSSKANTERKLTTEVKKKGKI